MIFNMTGGGVNPLNFTVKAYPSEVEMNTATAAVNTIGVATTNPITGWHFTSEQPKELKEGEVWFPTGTFTGCSFNALKKNNVTVYPYSAKQYVSGELKTVPAKLYQDEGWIDLWDGYLFNNGELFEHVTGGWWQNPNLSQWGSSYGGTATVGDTLKIQSNDYAGILTTKNAIDIAKFSYVIIDIVNIVNMPILFVHSFSTGNLKDSEAMLALSEGTSLDISGLTGKYYVSVGSNAGSGGEFSKIKLKA